MKCPYCDAGEVETTVVPEYATQLGGVPFVVRDAKIAKCNTCGGELFDAKELSRWEHELRNQLEARGMLVRPEQIRAAREAMGLGVSDFAFLMGVTRQTVHAWEQRDGRGMQLGPAALLLGFLADTVARGDMCLTEFLARSAQQRGQSIKAIDLGNPSADRQDVRQADGASSRIRHIPNGCPSFVPGSEAA